MELRRVWLGVVVEGIDVGDARDVGDSKGDVTTAGLPPLPPPIVLAEKVTASRLVRRHIWGLSKLDLLLLSPYPDTTHEVSKDPMLEEVASFATTSACTCATSKMASHPAQLAVDSVPLPIEHRQS